MIHKDNGTTFVTPNKEPLINDNEVEYKKTNSIIGQARL